MIKSFKNILLLSAASFISVAGWAQDAAPAAAPAASNASPESLMLYLLIAGCAVLLFAVLMLGNVWINLYKLALDKRDGVKDTPAPHEGNEGKTSSDKSLMRAVSIVLLLLCANFIFAQGGEAAPAGDKPFQLPVSIDMLTGIIVFGLELLVVIWMLISIRSLAIEISGEKKEARQWNFRIPLLFDNINASVPVEKEKDILLDHNYDGIRELDNALPPWWKYSFYLSIIWAFCYLGYFYFGGGPSSIDEYKAEVEQAKIDVDAFNKKNALNIDESNVKFADAAGIADGQDIFKTNCAACHGNLGEGNVGPNLTDDYWLHGGAANDLFKTVKYGWPAKGMKSWQSDLSAVQIKNVISYIHSIHGTNPPNAKAPQGDLISAEGTMAKTDSTVVAAADSTKK